MLGQYGETLVVDWGSAKLMSRAAVATMPEEQALILSLAGSNADTLPGSVLGTPAYMSPEQARGELESLGPASDVYSLVRHPYLLLTGPGPPSKVPRSERFSAPCRGRLPKAAVIEPKTERALEAVCLKAMATHSKGRYPTVRALAEDVERRIAGEPVSIVREMFWHRMVRTSEATAV